MRFRLPEQPAIEKSACSLYFLCKYNSNKSLQNKTDIMKNIHWSSFAQTIVFVIFLSKHCRTDTVHKNIPNYVYKYSLSETPLFQCKAILLIIGMYHYHLHASKNINKSITRHCCTSLMPMQPNHTASIYPTPINVLLFEGNRTGFMACYGRTAHSVYMMVWQLR